MAETSSPLAAFAERMGDSLPPGQVETPAQQRQRPRAATPPAELPMDEVEPEVDVKAAEKVFDLDAYLDADTKTKKNIADDLSPYWRKEGVLVSYQGVRFRLRRGVPASLAFSGTIAVGDQTELALLVHKEDRITFAEALVDDDRFLISTRDTDGAEKDYAASPAVSAWVDTRQIMQALAMERDPKG